MEPLAAQDDITDGVHWMIEKGTADPGRICIFGGSYGGYAALMGAAKEPDLFRCAAAVSAVSDIITMLSFSSSRMNRTASSMRKTRSSYGEDSSSSSLGIFERPSP